MFLQSSVLLKGKPGRILMNALKLFLVFCICFLTACTSHKLAPEVPMTSEAQEGKNSPLNKLQQPSEGNAKIQASAISSWELQGAIAARNQKKGWSATVNWLQQGPNQYQIRLMGPLGGGAIVIEKRGSVITYTDGSKKVSSRNADQLLQQQTGIRLPVQNLYYWVRGLPAPGGKQSAHYDTNHRLTSMTQSGYTIYFTDFASVNQVELPGKIQLQGNGAMIKLIVKHWRI